MKQQSVLCPRCEHKLMPRLLPEPLQFQHMVVVCAGCLNTFTVTLNPQKQWEAEKVKKRKIKCPACKVEPTQPNILRALRHFPLCVIQCESCKINYEVTQYPSGYIKTKKVDRP